MANYVVANTSKTNQEVVKPYLLQLAECSICSEIYSNQEKLVHHMSLVHQIKPADRPLQCPKCPLSFKNRFTLWNHKQTHLQRPHSFRCQHCPKAFQKKLSLSLHERTHQDEKPYACQLCSHKTNQFSNLKTHMLKHEAAQFKCNKCDRVFKHKGTLLKHIDSEHLGKKEMFPCLFCTKNYSCREALKKHVKVHTGEDIEEECPICHKMYRRIKDHMIMHEDKLFECNVCHKRFRRAPELKVHMRVHTGEKPYECKFCSKRFRQHAHYMSHLRSHTSEKVHQCNICKKIFSNPENIKMHMQKHDGTFVRKYTCTVCYKKFDTNRHLKIHCETHEERKKIECKKCGLKLVSDASLKAHMRKHEGIRFKCASCDREFYRGDMYKKHVLTHNDIGSVMYPCKDCGTQYETARDYTKHVRSCKV